VAGSTVNSCAPKPQQQKSTKDNNCNGQIDDGIANQNNACDGGDVMVVTKGLCLCCAIF
jgi:hypothetical protein